MPYMNKPADTIEPVDRALTFSRAVNVLQEKLREHSSTVGSIEETSFHTFSATVTAIDPLLWLHCQNVYPKFFWSNRENSDLVAGIGLADSIEYHAQGANSKSFDFLQQEISKKNPGSRYFGGLCFDNSTRQDEYWEAFKSLSFVLPDIEIHVKNGKTVLSCHLVLEAGKKPDAQYKRLLDLLSGLNSAKNPDNFPLPAIHNIALSPDKDEWLEACKSVLDMFRDGVMGKMILARRTSLEFTTAFAPLLFLLQHPFPDSSIFRFYFEPKKNTAFFSFSPERLYRRDNDRLLTEALAGTCSRDMLDNGKEKACSKLLNSEKDIREHKFVSDDITRQLEPICSKIDMEENLQALQLNRLVHLYTRCFATLKPESKSDAAILKALHPTPAVGGVPKTKALEQIMQFEPFSRGWYAGPIGWISRNSAEFAVGIRSAVASGKMLYLYSGAGLVKGSEPAAEWEEVDQKIADILAITRQQV